MRQHALDHRGHVHQHGRRVSSDSPEQRVRGAALLEEHRRGADREGEEEVGAGRVPEVELRDREGHIGMGEPQRPLAVQPGRVDQTAMCLHDDLRLAGRSSGEQPNGRVFRSGGKRVYVFATFALCLVDPKETRLPNCCS